MIGLNSCGDTDKSQAELENSEANTNSQITDNYQTQDTVQHANQIERDTIVYDSLIFPNENYMTKVLTIGVFHGDEVSENSDKKDWFGLFLSKQENYIARTKIKMKRVYDPVLDEENEKTGWEISTYNKDSCIILIEKIQILSEKKIQKIEFQNTIYPKDTVTINYLGIKYKIFATGGGAKGGSVWNYKLFISANIKGENRKSLLIAAPNFDDTMTSILFAGDIDGDGILDLIIDTSRKYGGVNPTIYLSKPASNGEILKPIGEISSVGC